MIFLEISNEQRLWRKSMRYQFLLLFIYFFLSFWYATNKESYVWANCGKHIDKMVCFSVSSLVDHLPMIPCDDSSSTCFELWTHKVHFLLNRVLRKRRRNFEMLQNKIPVLKSFTNAHSKFTWLLQTKLLIPCNLL